MVVASGNFAPPGKNITVKSYCCSDCRRRSGLREIADGGLRLKPGRFFACLAMVGVGAIAGTLSGGYTNAARSPGARSTEVAADHSPAVHAPAVARVATASDHPFGKRFRQYQHGRHERDQRRPSRARASNAAPARAEPAPSAVIAMRFPSNWQQQAQRPSAGDNDPPPLTMAYAVEPQRAQPAPPAAAPSTGGYALASVDPNPRTDPEPAPMPKRMAKPEKPKPPVLFNDAQLASIKARLRLTRDQEAHWPRVEDALRAISWKIATQSGHRLGQAAGADDRSEQPGSRAAEVGGVPADHEHARGPEAGSASARAHHGAEASRDDVLIARRVTEL